MNNDFPPPIILWFRRDLRLADNPALCFACEQNQPIIPVYVWSPEEDGVWQIGEASRWWLHQSLEQLNKSLFILAQGSQQSLTPLIIRLGDSLVALSKLIAETGASTVCWNRLYEPVIYERDRLVERKLRSNGVLVKTFKAGLLYEPWAIKTKSNTLFKVFTPFWKKSLQFVPSLPPRPRPSQIQLSHQKVQSLTVKSLELLSDINWYSNIQKYWQPGEVAAKQKLDIFLDSTLLAYDENRDFPGQTGTSLLSAYLHFGEISPKQIWHAIMQKERKGGTGDLSTGKSAYLRQISWREFAHHVLFNFPYTETRPLDFEFLEFPWQHDKNMLRSWQEGRTGYPIVDAGMRQLWQMGWIHNRVRMVVASFFVKHLQLGNTVLSGFGVLW